MEKAAQEALGLDFMGLIGQLTLSFPFLKLEEKENELKWFFLGEKARNLAVKIWKGNLGYNSRICKKRWLWELKILNEVTLAMMYDIQNM